MAYSSSSSLLITAPATGFFQEHHNLKCGAVALTGYQYASSFVSATARMSKSKSKSKASSSSSRIIFRCNSQLADLAPATSAAYGLLLLGGGLFACKLSHLFFKFWSFLFFIIFLIKLISLHNFSVYKLRPLDTKSGSKGSLFGGTTGAALMASVSLAFHTAFSTSNISSTIYLFIYFNCN